MENSRAVFHTRHQVGSKMEVISEEVEHPHSFYLSSLEEQARCELLDSEARITQTKIKDRILLEINEDCLQHFLDVVHEKTEEEMEIHMIFFQANANMKLKNCHLLWQQEKSSYQAQMDKQRAELNRIAAALKETQDLLETARHVQPKTTTEEEMEVFKNLCQATVDEQLEVSSKLKEDLDHAKQELKNGRLQWQEEKSSLKARQQKNCDHFHSQVQVIASIRAQEQEAVKQTLEKAQALNKAQMEEQRVETNQQLDENSKLNAALIKAENELTNRHLLWQQEKSSYQAQMDKQRAEINRIAAALKETQDLTINKQFGENSKLKAAFIKAENELKYRQLLWQKEKSSYQAQMDEQRAETSMILAVLKKTADQLEAEHLNCLELVSCNAHLEKTCRDLNHAQLKNLATLQTLEEETTQMFKRNRASQAQLEEQRAETNGIKAARKKTEDMFENERLLWQQEKYLLQATEEDLQSQITNMQKKKKKWFKLFSCRG